MGLLIDTTPLRVSRDFRRLWIGQAVSFLGSTMTAAALPFQVYHQTGLDTRLSDCSAWRSSVRCLMCSIVGGALRRQHRQAPAAPRRDRRGHVAVLRRRSRSTPRSSHPQLWVLYVLGAVAAGVTAVTYPGVAIAAAAAARGRAAAGRVRLAVDVRIVRHDGRPRGRRRAHRRGRVHEYVRRRRPYLCLRLASCSRGIASSPPVGDGAPAPRSRRCSHGLRFLRGQPVIMSVFGIDLLAMIFGMPRALFPALTARLGGGAGAVRVLVVGGRGGRVHRVDHERLDGSASGARAAPCSSRSRSGAPRSPSPDSR